MTMNDNELKSIIGGAFTATFLSAIIRGIKLIIDFGRALGTAFRMVCSKTTCSS